MRSWLALGLVLAAGCGTSSIDPCAGQVGPCVGVHVATEVQPLDQIRVTLGGAQSMVTPASAAGPLDFPVRFAVTLPAGTTGASLGFDGLEASVAKAHAAGDVVLDASGHGTLDVTLTALGGDGGADLATGIDLATTVDLAGYDFAGSDLAGADLAGADLAISGVALTVSAITVSGGAGTLAVVPFPVTSCGTNCTTYAAGTNVGIQATPGGTSVLLGWGGGVPTSCQGKSSCSITLTADTGVVAVFSSAAMNRAFATSATYSVAQLGSSAVNADGFCQSAAAAAGLADQTSFHALLAAGGGSGTTKLGSSRGWVRLDGLPFADDPTSLFGGAVYYPVALDETGHPSTNKVWAGMTTTGAPGANCNDWTMTTNASTASYGFAADGSNSWLDLNTQGCDQSAALYCFSTVSSNALTVDAPPGRRAFVTNTAWSPATGPTGADGVCNSDANGHGLGTGFKAYLNGSSVPGLSRFDLTGGLWHRLDNVLLAPSTRTTLIESGDPQRLGPLITGPGGGRYGPGVIAWLGSASANCADWTVNTSASMGTAGSVQRAGYGVAPVSCALTELLFCLEQ